MKTDETPTCRLSSPVTYGRTMKAILDDSVTKAVLVPFFSGKNCAIKVTASWKSPDVDSPNIKAMTTKM